MTSRISPAKRIVVIDDHPIVRRGIVDTLNAEKGLTVCAEASTVSEAIAAVREHRPHVALVDLALGSESGLELIKDLKAMHKHLSILVVSIHDETLYAERVLKAGALGYINKQEALDHIVAAIRRVLSGKVYLSPEMADRLLHQMAAGIKPGDQSPLERLSDRELEVYRMLGQGKGTREIAADLHLSMKTIETYREHIKVKLHLADSNEMICHAARWVAEQT